MKIRALLLACIIAAPASAAVTKLTVEKITPMAGGYELLEGHFSGALAPNDKRNAVINDIMLMSLRLENIKYFMDPGLQIVLGTWQIMA